MIGQRLPLNGLDALRQTQELGFLCPCGPSLALGQPAFYGALTTFDRPLNGATLETRLPACRRDRGRCPPSGRPALGRLNPEGVLPLTAPPEGHVPPWAVGRCYGRKAYAAPWVLYVAKRRLRG